MAPIFYGTITAHPSQRDMLESFGITLAGYDPANGVFLARADKAAVNALTDFEIDFPHRLYGRMVDSPAMQLRPGMTFGDLDAEAAFIRYQQAQSEHGEQRPWQMAANAVQAMRESVTKARGPETMRLSGKMITALMRLNGKTIESLARAMGITQKRVREVRERGVAGEGYVLDWVEALSASAAEPSQPVATAQALLDRVQVDLAHQAALSDDQRLDAINARADAYHDADRAAKSIDIEACGDNVNARLAVTHRPYLVLLDDDAVRTWAALEARELSLLDAPQVRESAAVTLAGVMRANPDFCAHFNETHPEAATLVGTLCSDHQHREMTREGRKQGLNQPLRPDWVTASEFTVITRQTAYSRDVVSYPDAQRAVQALMAAKPEQRPYLLVNHNMALYRPGAADAVQLTHSCSEPVRQAYAQFALDPSKLAHAMEEGARRKDVALYAPEEGVFIGEVLGGGFWSNLENLGLTTISTFPSVQAARESVATWITQPKDVRYVFVEAEPDGTSTMQACMRAGLPGWDITPTDSHDASPTLH
ncbi:hypothetical protein [Cupriavidus sp. TMH.W2]|uniref:hypothetical protein n=1 Tax=Cupriavidus sp. TMH.W2 TaxID=3434465 RepID=UPI003D785ACE